MINNLGKKITAINVISVCIVFFVAIAFVFAIGYSKVDAERNMRILDAFNFDYEKENFADNQQFDDILLVVYDKSANNCEYFIGKHADISKEEISGGLTQILNGKSENGWLSWQIRYAKQTEGDVVKIVFNNRYARQNSIAPYLFSTLAAVLFGIAAYFVISRILSSIALKPVVESWNKQKQFVADASHELKTPLSVIMANTEIIASHPDETVASQMKWIENTRVESQRMAVLVADLLFLAKNDDGLKVQMENVNVSDCVETTVLSYDAVFYENGKKFNYEIAPDVNVWGNVKQIQQLVTILLDNANKYSVGDGNISLTLAATSRQVTLTVSNDSGEVTEEQLSHLFDRFYTIDQSRNSDKGGNGLGLSIAKVICETHKGDISADYADGRMRFTVTLPVKKIKDSKE